MDRRTSTNHGMCRPQGEARRAGCAQVRYAPRLRKGLSPHSEAGRTLFRVGWRFLPQEEQGARRTTRSQNAGISGLSGCPYSTSCLSLSSHSTYLTVTGLFNFCPFCLILLFFPKSFPFRSLFFRAGVKQMGQVQSACDPFPEGVNRKVIS